MGQGAGHAYPRFEQCSACGKGFDSSRGGGCCNECASDFCPACVDAGAMQACLAGKCKKQSTKCRRCGNPADTFNGGECEWCEEALCKECARWISEYEGTICRQCYTESITAKAHYAKCETCGKAFDPFTEGGCMFLGSWCKECSGSSKEPKGNEAFAESHAERILSDEEVKALLDIMDGDDRR